MSTIYFDKDEYKAGETATISYADAPTNSLVGVRRGGVIIHRKVLVSGGSGSFDYKVPTTLGTYKAELWSESRIIAHDTMEVVTGAAPPADKGTLKVNTSPTGATVTVNGVSCGTTPVTACALSTGSKTVTITKSGYNTATRSVTITAGQTSNLGTITLTPTAAPPAEGETRELDLGDYEVIWTLSGNDTLKAEITVTDTGVTCISVTAGACNSSTPPGVTISTFTVTGHLKSAALPPPQGSLKVDTRPTGASVTVDGVSCGITPVYACTLSVGAKTVTITKSGYNTVTRSVTIAGGQTSDLGIITLTPTGVPPSEMTKAEFIAEVQNRGEIDLSKITTSSGWNKWVKKGYAGYWRLDYSDGIKYLIEIWNVHARNPPTRESDIHFFDIRLATPTPLSKIETAWVLARINALPFVGVAPPVEIGSWIDESGVTNLTKDHAVYVFFVSAGAVSAADGKYAKLSPKPSRLDPSLASKDNAIGIFYYSQGAMAAGNGKTGCNY